MPIPVNSTETAQSGQWTVETALRHMMTLSEERDRRYEQRFDAQEKALQTAFMAQEKGVTAAFACQKEAVSKAENANEKRMEGVRRELETLTNQQDGFMPKSESVLGREALAARVSAMEILVRDVQSERQGVARGINLVLGGIALIATLIAIAQAFFHK